MGARQGYFLLKPLTISGHAIGKLLESTARMKLPHIENLPANYAFLNKQGFQNPNTQENSFTCRKGR